MKKMDEFWKTDNHFVIAANNWCLADNHLMRNGEIVLKDLTYEDINELYLILQQLDLALINYKKDI